MARTKGRARSVVGEAGAGLPRYQDLAAELIAAIESGTYPVGSQFPSEPQLCERFGVSRFTVRAALDSLQRKGYVSRRPKIGTLVIADRPLARYSIAVTGTADLLRFSREMKYRVLQSQDVTADVTLARDLECAVGETWLRIAGCRVTPQAGLAVSLADYFVRPEHRRVLAGIEAAGAGATPIYARIEQAAGEPVLEIRQEINACAMAREQAQRLGIAEGSAAFRMVHKMFGAEASRPLYAIVSTFPAERFSFTQTLRLEE
ncbi:MAG: GntR family transcriptional regulator [Comamonadaceae bacterium]|nr:GntR family transcriptional regulator [Rubrivivax sp.]NLZ41867.1 GntR family transcriptional regulator [Comamonadaceae bacterium]